LHFITSNSLERLFADLAAILESEIPDPFTPALVVAPNPATARWLTHRLAARQGIAANLDMPLPASFFWRVLRAWLPEAEASPFDPESLAWRILAVLPARVDAPEFAELKRYLDDDDGRGMKRFQLARRIAESFDQYLVYRPEAVLEWERGGGEGWQPLLWRALAEGRGDHRARLMRRLLEAMEQPPADGAALPERIVFFGVNALAPVYLEILRKLAAHRDAVLFHLNPCREYWADIRSERGLAHHDDPQSAFLEVGNPLLASMGHVGQVFLDQLLSLDGDPVEDFVEPSGDGALPAIQRDILDLRDGGGEPAPMPEEGWSSIQFHGAHTPFREVQILHDNLLRCLDEIDGLRPRDILVMAPDMAAYAPFVEAVFGTAERERWMPYSIGDRGAGAEDPLGDAMRWLLDLPASRITASEVLKLLEAEAVRHRLGLDAEAVERIRQWVAESGVRWAIDGAHREALDLPGDDGLHSWRFGLRRLFLGFATPADDDETSYGDSVIPYLDIEGAELTWAGALQTLIDRLDYWRKALAADCPPAEWQPRISRLFGDFFDARDENDRALLQMATARLDDVIAQAESAGFTDDLPLAAVSELLGEALDESTPARGFLDGGVTFSNLLPMRALPFRVIALLGMNDADFPRQSRAPSFDLIAQQPRRGDRDRRRDDRYVFLETLISARDCLLISWQSRDARSDKPRLPAEVVSELMDYLDARFLVDGQKASDKLFVQHPLQPFDRRYFDGGDPRLFSHDASWAIGQAEKSESPFVDGPLNTVDEIEEIELGALLSFFHNPARAFLTQSLGIRLPGEEDAPDDSEPFSLDGLSRWQLSDRLLRRGLDEKPLIDAARRFAGEGQLPHGVVGEVQRERLASRAEKLRSQVSPWLDNNPWRQPVPLDLTIGERRLTGSLDRVTDKGVIDFRVGRLRAVDRIALWIRHLVFALAVGQGESVFIAEEETFRLRSIDKGEARKQLADLLDLYAAGLHEPLRFFPQTTWDFINEKKDWESAFWGGYKSTGEADDPAVRLVFRHIEALEDPFERIARGIWEPVIAYQEEA